MQRITKKKHTKEYLKSLLTNTFLYNEKVYKQTDGVAMGSPGTLLLVNLFVASKENFSFKAKTELLREAY